MSGGSFAPSDSGGGPAPAASIGDVLRQAPPTVVEAHLTWLVARTRREPQLSPQRVLYEDQSKILIDALEERDEHDAVLRAVATPWILEDVEVDDGELGTYAGALEGVTAGQPRHSPFVALAQSATRCTSEIAGYRRSQASPRSA